MAITINGSGTIGGLSSGGLPDGSVTAADIESSLDLSGKTVTLPSGVGGKLLQVVQSTTRSVSSINSNSYASTGLSLSITPTDSSSKVFLTSNFGWSCNTADFGYYAFGVNGTADTNTTIVCFNQSSTNASNSLYYSTISYLYTPGTTSTQTYTLQFRCGAAPTQTMYFNQRGIGGPSNGLCTITAMEIAA